MCLHVFGKLQQRLLLPHLSNYLRSLGAYDRAGHDFIRSMLFFWLPQSGVCVLRGWGYLL